MQRGNAAPLPAHFPSFFFRPPRFFVYPGGHNGQNVLTQPSEREQPRRSETGIVCLREDDCAETLCGRAFLIYPAADSQNRARRPPRPEMSERERRNRAEQYGAKKKKTAGAGAQTEKRKPREKKKRPPGAGKKPRPKQGKPRTRGREQRGEDRGQKKGAGAAKPSPTYRAESGAYGTGRPCWRSARADYPRSLRAARPRAAYPRRDPACASPGSVRQGKERQS